MYRVGVNNRFENDSQQSHIFCRHQSKDKSWTGLPKSDLADWASLLKTYLDVPYYKINNYCLSEWIKQSLLTALLRFSLLQALHEQVIKYCHNFKFAGVVAIFSIISHKLLSVELIDLKFKLYNVLYVMHLNTLTWHCLFTFENLK